LVDNIEKYMENLVINCIYIKNKDNNKIVQCLKECTYGEKLCDEHKMYMDQFENYLSSDNLYCLDKMIYYIDKIMTGENMEEKFIIFLSKHKLFIQSICSNENFKNATLKILNLLAKQQNLQKYLDSIFECVAIFDKIVIFI